MRVFVTGATGYIGKGIVRELLKKGHSVSLFIRAGSEAKLDADENENVETVIGDLHHPDKFRENIVRSDAIINLPGLIREFPGKGITFEDVHVRVLKALVDVAVKSPCQRFLQMSALGVRADSHAKYQQTKYRAEMYLRSSGLQWTIFRPSLIFGNEYLGDENFFIVLKKVLTMMPCIVPVLGSGKYRFQPIALKNVAEGFVTALNTSPSIGKIYEMGGPDIFTYSELLDLAGVKLGIDKLKVYQPLWVMKILASLFGKYKLFPFTRDQIIMMEEESLAPAWKEYFEEFNIVPVRLPDGLELIP
jgi:uncharacterized protein YbjT (DUF2867 family)